MSEKEQKKKEKELKNVTDQMESSDGERESTGQADKMPGDDRQNADSVPNVQGPSGYGQPGGVNPQDQIPGQQPGPGHYGYQNPYQNNWQNQKY